MIEVEFGPNDRQFKRPELLECSPTSSDPTSDLEAGRFGTPTDLQRILTFEKIKGALTNVFYSMEASNTTFYPHQFKPVMRFIESPNGRLLIADEVGLGKTIEAAYIWKELQARTGARRLLIVCPAMLRQKWQDDLRKRFNISADIVTARDLLAKLEDLAFSRRPDAFVWITSLENIRAPVQFENEALTNTRARLARLLDQHPASEDYALLDHVIIDEAHYLRNPSTGNHRVARLLAEASAHLVLLTATPIQLGNENLYQLLRLINPETFYDPITFGGILDANKFIVQAQRALWRDPPDRAGALSAISGAALSPYFRSDGVLDQVETTLRKGLETPADRVSVLRRLESRSLLAKYMTRSRKREVLENRVQRTPQVLTVRFSPVELAVYQRVTDRIRQNAIGKSTMQIFSLIARQRQMASSIVGALESWAEKGVADELLWEDFGKLHENPLHEGGSDDANDASDVADGAEVQRDDPAAFELVDGKYSALRQFLRGQLHANRNEKFVVFAFFRGTLKYLARRLAQDGIAAILLMGGSSEPKDEIVQRFAEASGPSVLLSSEIGSEGIDLQFCRFVVNYDLPWNPMKVEQRIGRIDRLGQSAERISIVSLYVENSIEERVLMRLYERINVFHESIGDMEEILGEVTDNLLSDLFNPNLSDAERERQANASLLAAANTQMQQKQLEQQAINLVGFSDFILGQISDSRKQGRWLSPGEMINLIHDFFARSYSGTVLTPDSDIATTFHVVLSTEARHHLAEFIEERKLGVATQLHRAHRPVRCVFDARTGARGRFNFEIIEAAHPLIQWIRATYEADPRHLHRVSAVEATGASAPVPAGDYAFSIHRWSFQGLRSEQLLAYRACAIRTEQVLDESLAEELVTWACGTGSVIPNAANVLPPLDSIGEAYFRCEQELEQAYGRRLAEAESENALHCEQQEVSAKAHTTRRLEELRGRLDRFRLEGNDRMIPMTEGLVRREEQDQADKLRRIERRRVVDDSMVPLASGYIRVKLA
jgi:superfamily II DNA or RNA helicase